MRSTHDSAERQSGRLRKLSWRQTLGRAGVLFAMVVLLSTIPVVRDSQVRLSDSFFRLAPAPRQASQIVLVLIDDESLQKYGRWPWSRTVLAELNTRLAQAGARVIGIDILLSEPQSQEADLKLSESFRASGRNVIVDKIGIFPDGPRWVEPLPAFVQTATVGHAQAVLDADSVCRKFPPRELTLDGPRRAFAIEVARLADPLRTKSFLEANELAGRSAATDVAGPALMRIPFRRDEFEKVSARTVLDGNAVGFLRGRPVLVGFGAAEIGDRLATPLSRSMPTSGVEIHAQILDSILTQRAIRDISSASSAIILFLCCVVSVALFRVRRGWMGLAWMVMMLSSAYAAGFLVYVLAGRMPAVGAMILTFIFGPLLVYVADFIQVEHSVAQQLLGLHSWLRQPGFGAATPHDLSWKLQLLQDLQTELGALYELHRALLESSQDLVALFDEHGKLLVNNQLFSDVYSSDRKQITLNEFRSRLSPKTEANPGENEFYLGSELYLLRQTPLPPTYISPKGGTILTMTSLRAREQRDQARAETLAFVTHELRTPLTSIHGFAELMIRYPSSPSCQSAPDTIVREAKRLLAMIDTYLNVLRLDAGSQRLQVSRLDLEELVEDVFEVLQPLAAANRIQLAMSSPRESVLALGDRALIHGAVLNLVSNAIKYGKPGTGVVVTCREIHNKTVIAVQNQGDTISAEDLPHVFDSYFRTANAEMTATGWGLGLTFVKRIAEKHGGSVTVESGLGTIRFEIHLPVHASVAAGTELIA